MAVINTSSLAALSGPDLTALASTTSPSDPLRALIDQERGRRVLARLEQPNAGPTVLSTKASSIKAEPVSWTWEGRIPVGMITLLAGREGQGKSTIATDVGARLTRGALEGEHYGMPRNVVICATEDSFKHTIVPRLMGAGADLDRVELLSMEAGDVLTFPRDLPAVSQIVSESNAALFVLDPLMSRIDPKVDTHKDGPTRTVLEPIKIFAEEYDVAVLGLIHFNKSRDQDILNMIMGSKAIAAVARSVLAVTPSPDDDGEYFLTHPKCNVGPKQASLGYAIEGKQVAESLVEGDIWTSRIQWKGQDSRSAEELHEAATGDSDGNVTAVDEAAGWLVAYFESAGGAKASSLIKSAAMAAGLSWRTVQRAKKKAGVTVRYEGRPPTTLWEIERETSV